MRMRNSWHRPPGSQAPLWASQAQYRSGLNDQQPTQPSSTFRYNRNQGMVPSESTVLAAPSPYPAHPTGPSSSRPFVFGQGTTDSYRPGDFSFRAQYDGRPAPDFSRGRNDPPSNPRRRHPAEEHHLRDGRPYNQGRGGKVPNHSQSNQDSRPFQPKPKTSERPLLQGQRSPTPDQLTGMNEGQQPLRFNLDDVAMNAEPNVVDLISRSGSDEEEGEVPRKKVMTEAPSKNVDALTVPKWTNPDPYTALPPPAETTAKKPDFIGMIRKAKADAGKEAPVVNYEKDFISLDDEDASRSVSKPNGICSTDPQVGHITFRPDRDSLPSALTTGSNANGTAISVTDPGSPPPPPPEISYIDPRQPMPPPPPPPPKTLKRKREDVPRKEADIVSEWQGLDSPWHRNDLQNQPSASTHGKLHKEICDFYAYARPREFEYKMRLDLVTRLQHFINTHLPGAEVRFFGSFASGVYLPNADMDLVILSPQFRSTGFRMNQSNPGKPVLRLADSLRASTMTKSKNVIAIARAKVPIVKYIDSITGLRVDVSFDNDTGLIANTTYNLWKSRYPAMPVIVTLAKHFLAMRGLSEVHSGGLGGFTVTCLVVSLMQHLPELQSGSMDPMTHLGDLFMLFLELYGVKFNTVMTGIRMDPPGYFPKVSVSLGWRGSTSMSLPIAFSCPSQLGWLNPFLSLALTSATAS